MRRKMAKVSLGKLRVFSVLFLMACHGGIALMAQSGPKKYIAIMASEPMDIDGKMEEHTWALASWSDDFIDIEGDKIPGFKTNVKMVWDSDYLYFFARLEEPNVWATLKQRDTVIFYDNDFEIFIDPDGDTHNYMEFEINAFNTVWDLFLTKPYRNHGKVLNNWDIQGLKTAVHVRGTLNEAADVDDGWNVEIAFPWKVLNEANGHNKVPEGEFWRIGFSRVNWEYDLINNRYRRKKDKEGKFLPEFNWVWSPQWVVNMHEPEKWGYVYFSGGDSETDVDFEIPEDEYVKWYLYELYRDRQNEKSRKVIWKKKKGEVVSEGPSKVFFGKTVRPLLEKCETGITIFAESPFTGHKLVIQEDGKFKSYAIK